MNIQNIIETKVKEGFLAIYKTEIPSVEFQATRKEFEVGSIMPNVTCETDLQLIDEGWLLNDGLSDGCYRDRKR